MLTVPLVLTYDNNYQKVFPAEWYDMTPTSYWGSETYPCPLGLSLGLSAVVVGHIFVLAYFIARRAGALGALTSIQKDGARPYALAEGLTTHLAQPEGFVMLGSYLTGTWMLGLMPASYYSFHGGINWPHVLAQLLIQDALQYVMHGAEHLSLKVKPAIYVASHKPHHVFTNPRFFDAFNGSPADTFLMILVPLYITALLVPANVWSYMAFGSMYANWLTLIHAEYRHPWDGVFRALGLGTAADHHVHHRLYVFNYGHLFMYWDYMLGTYKNPKDVIQFNKDV
jgi:sterol desaturase/sphingolipid hydroxylase (fatty acid hydroxylase superfamily)